MAEQYTGRTCPFCQGVIKPADSVVTCSVCHTVHHHECWLESGACTTPGCRGVPQTQLVQSAPHSPAVSRPAPVDCPPNSVSSSLRRLASMLGWQGWLFAIIAVAYLSFMGFVQFDAWRARQKYMDAYATSDHAELKRLAPLQYAAMLQVGESGRFGSGWLGGFGQQQFGTGFDSKEASGRAKAYRKATELLAQAKATARENRGEAGAVEMLRETCQSLRGKAEAASAPLLAPDAWRQAESKSSSSQINDLLAVGGFKDARTDLKEAMDAYQEAIKIASQRQRQYDEEARRHGGLGAYAERLKQRAHSESRQRIQQYFDRFPGSREQFEKSTGIWVTDKPVFTRIRGVLRSLKRADDLLSNSKDLEACVEYDSALSLAASLQDQPRPEDSKMEIKDPNGIMQHRMRVDSLKRNL
jgi:hypothetical protein